MMSGPFWSRAFGLAGPLLLLATVGGCDALNSARNDLSRLTTSKTAPAPAKPVAATAARTAPSKAGTTPVLGRVQESAVAGPATTIPTAPAGEAAPSLVGRSELEVQALFGTPSSTEDRPPGKIWHYRDGMCALDVRLFPDVQTRQFGTLSYEVRSDDNSDQGKRACLAQLRARAQAQR